MGKTTGFLEFKRQMPRHRPVEARIQDYLDVVEPLPVINVQEQAARCMDCGIPFCQSGCPIGNQIPEWNDLAYRGRWHEAFIRLQATNNFPEFTGRLCPAPCESACVLGLVDQPVTIEQIEQTIAEVAYREGWVVPRPPSERTGRSVAVIGSGPAGLAAADQLNRAGHFVTVFERDDRIGGLLRYGIPDFKLEKSVLDRRLDVMVAEGVTFRPGTSLGENESLDTLEGFDAVVLCIGATSPRDLAIEGRGLSGIHYAWDYLVQQNRRVAGDHYVREAPDAIWAEDLDVIVIGGGDTGSDCVGTANRQFARSITQFEITPVPPEARPAEQPWPLMPLLLKETSSHEEGAARHWQIMTTRFVGEQGRITGLDTVQVRPGPQGRLVPQPGTERRWPADLVLLAIGYTGPQRQGLLEQLDVRLTDRGVIATDSTYATNNPGIFAAGDGRRGQSLIVWAIAEGREVARHVDNYLAGASQLPRIGAGDLPRSLRQLA